MKAPTAGARVGSWTLEERLGVGGMGEVWRAGGPRGTVALKVLHRKYHDPESVRRFEREARAQGQIDHPNVAQALDFGEDEEGQYYLAMELLEGESLAQRLERRDILAPDEVIEVGIATATGLGAAHAVGLVHRDVKPGNLFLCDDGTLKILDFGLAVWSGIAGSSSEEDQTRLTQVGIVIGTPSYMSPEQAAGERSEDRRTDVWAVGAVLHHALSGRPPFHAGGNPIAELFRIITEPPDPLPESVPRGLRDVIERALHKVPSERYQTTSALADALAELMSPEDVPLERAPTVPPGQMQLPAEPLTPEVVPDSRPLPRRVNQPSTSPAGGDAAFEEEVRLVVAVLAEGVRGPDSLRAFLDAVRSAGGTASPVRGRRAVGVFGGASWAGDETERAVDTALAMRKHARRIGVGTGKAVYVPGQQGAVTGAALTAAADALWAVSADVQAAATRRTGRIGPATTQSIGATRASGVGGTSPVAPEAMGDTHREAAVDRVSVEEAGPDTVIDLDASLSANQPDDRDSQPVSEEDEESPPAHVRVCPETLRRVQRHFLLDGNRIISKRAGRRRLGVRDSGLFEVPLVGRGDELRRLQSMATAVERDGQEKVVLLVGPPGIGKSRLRHELETWFRRQEGTHLYLEARGEAGRAHSSHAAIGGMLRARAGLPEGTATEIARARLEKLVSSAGVPQEQRPGTVDFLGELLGIQFPENQHLLTARTDPRVMADRIRLALGDLLEAWTRRGPVMLVLEDAQWADSASIELLELLVSRLQEAPLLVVVTARPELLVERPQAFARGERIELGELRRSETETIVRGILGEDVYGDRDFDQQASQLAERAGGNPYFAEELSLAVREGATLAALPLTVEGAVQSRLDKLVPQRKDLLKRAAVLGIRFWAEALDALGASEVDAALLELAQRGLVQPREPSGLAACSEWVFRQAVVHQVCLGMLTDAQRQALHGRAGAWLGERPDATGEEVAEHFRAAGELEAAQHWWLRAVRVAHRRGDSEKVLHFSARALDGTTQLEPSEEHSLRRRRAEALFWQGRMEEEALELERLETLEGSGEIRVGAQAEVQRQRALNLSSRGRAQEAIRAAYDAISLADEAVDPTLSVRCRASAAEVLTLDGVLDEAEEVAEECLEHAKAVENPLERAHALHAVAAVASARGNIARGLDGYRSVRELFGVAGDVRRELMAGASVAAALQALGAYDGARGISEEVATQARRLALRSVEVAALQSLAMAVARSGDPVAGSALAEASRQLAQATGQRRLALSALAYQAIIEREAGVPHKALEHADEVLRHVEGSGGMVELMTRAIRAAALVDLGRATEALRETERGLQARNDAGGMQEAEIDLLLAAYDARIGLGDEPGGTEVLQEAWHRFRQQLSQMDDGRLRKSFSEEVPANARLRELMASRGELLDD